MRALTILAMIGYVAVIAGAIGLEVRPPHNAPLVEDILTHTTSFLWVAGGSVALATAWQSHWLEKLGTSFVLGGCLIGLANAVLLDIVPSWPPLSRPVLTSVGLVMGVLFFSGRLIDLRDERPRLPAEDAIERADTIRGMPA